MREEKKAAPAAVAGPSDAQIIAAFRAYHGRPNEPLIDGAEAARWKRALIAALAAAPTAQEAPRQSAQEPCPTCVALARTVMLDQVSLDRKPDCYGIRQITDDEGVEEWEDIRTSPDVAREEANDMMATGRGEIYEVVPLYTAPQAAPVAQGDAEDAARWRFVTDLDNQEFAVCQWSEIEREWLLVAHPGDIDIAMAKKGGAA